MLKANWEKFTNIFQNIKDRNKKPDIEENTRKHVEEDMIAL